MMIRKAKIEELPVIMELYAAARSFMAQTGNPEQWGEVYPPEHLVRSDIERGVCYVADVDGQIEAVFMYAFETDPDYQVLEEGSWLNDAPYGVVHRVASRGRIKGIGAKCILWGFEQCGNLKMDTHEDNKVMQHVLEKNGFVRCGRVCIADGLRMIVYQKTRPQMEMRVGDYATIDLERGKRQGMPEVIYGESKTAEQIAGIAQAMQEKGIENIMVTRLSKEKEEEVRSICSGEKAQQEQKVTGKCLTLWYDPVSRIGIFNKKEKPRIGKIVVVAAGTSDLPVAEEAAVTAELYGNQVERVYDVGVAGIHRLLHRLPVFEDAKAVIAVAGMEGALVSVVGGLVACPVIGVPTSVGYGANFGGLAALLSMLNSCASGVSVVNIDNGFGAGVLASKINRQSCGVTEVQR